MSSNLTQGTRYAVVAQLGERHLGTMEVTDSISVFSTTFKIASCQSGLLAHLGKVMVPQGAREFESLTRCHTWKINCAGHRTVSKAD